MNSFIALTHVFVDSKALTGFLQGLTGKKQPATSILRDINLRLDAGSWTTVFGHSGAGKTTLLKVLAGSSLPTKGHIAVNGHTVESQQLSLGYVDDSTSSSPTTLREYLAVTHKASKSASAAAELFEVVKRIGIDTLLDRSVATLSKSQHIKANITRAILAQAPVILLDDVADELGPEETKRILGECCTGHTVLITTRFTKTAEELELPIVLIHNGTLAHVGTCEEIADTVSCPRVLDAWVENLRYDILKKIRNHPGVAEVRLLPTSQFAGQRVRITLLSSRYLPSMYDLISQTSLVRVNELPPSLTDILAKL